MPMTQACRIELSREFGTRIDRNLSALNEAVSWMERTLWGERFHKNLKVQSCNAPLLEPIGIKRIDDMLYRDCDFCTGNVSSNMQSSNMLPAFSTCRVNGFTVIDGKQLLPGDLQALALKPILQSRWNDQQDHQALKGVQDALKAVQPDRGTTLYRIMHMRTKETRHLGQSPVHTHGWLLIDDHDELRYEHRIGNTAAGHKLFERAKKILTHEHTDPKTLLEIKDGQFTFVAPEVMATFKALGNVQTAEEISAFVVTKAPWDDSKEENNNNEVTSNAVEQQQETPI